MGGERLARGVLALDAVYCVVVGLLLVVFRARVGGLLRLPGVGVAVAGAATAASAGILIGQAVRIDWRRGIKQTMAANAGVSMVLALAAALHPARGARVLLAFFALDVISFAVAQGVSLVRRGLRS